MLIAEDLLLLLLDDASGRPQSSQLELALGGGVLVELALGGAVEVAEKTSVWRSAKVRPVPGAAPEDPVLRAGLAVVAEKERSAEDLVKRLARGSPTRSRAAWSTGGILERRDDKVLGLFSRTRWPARDSSHEERVRHALTAVLVAGSHPDPRTGALVALLHAVDRSHQSVPHEGLRAGEVKRRAKEVAEGDWAAKAVKDAVAAATAATTAAITAATAAAATGSG